MQIYDHKTLLLGEPMGLFAADQLGTLDKVDSFLLTTCGAELNVAIGIRRLEHAVSYMTKLGHDPFGRRIVNAMTAAGISTDMITYSDTHPTGFMFKSMVSGGDPEIYYFRRGSAASTLCADDVIDLDLSGFDYIHLTGITPAISTSAREAVAILAKRAKAEGKIFSFDPNLRPQLWSSHREMADCINSIAVQSDIFLPGIKEVQSIQCEEEPERAADYYLSQGTGCVIIKLGARGAYYATAEERGYVPGFHIDTIVDTVGAGDGFAAGVLTARMEGLSLPEAVRRGCAVGAIQLTSRGDNDGLPTREELFAFMDGRPDWRKQKTI